MKGMWAQPKQGAGVSHVCSGRGAETSSGFSVAVMIQFCVCFGWGDTLCGAFVSRICQN